MNRQTNTSTVKAPAARCVNFIIEPICRDIPDEKLPERNKQNVVSGRVAIFAEIPRPLRRPSHSDDPGVERDPLNVVSCRDIIACD